MWTSLFKSGTVKESVVNFTRDGKTLSYKVISGKHDKHADTWIVNEDKFGVYLIPETRGFSKFRNTKFWVSREEMEKELSYLFSGDILPLESILSNNNIEVF